MTGASVRTPEAGSCRARGRGPVPEMGRACGE